MTVERSNALSKALMTFLALLTLTVIVLLAALPDKAKADPTSPPGNGQAGQHGKHKGRPFQSPDLPE